MLKYIQLQINNVLEAAGRSPKRDKGTCTIVDFLDDQNMNYNTVLICPYIKTQNDNLIKSITSARYIWNKTFKYIKAVPNPLRDEV
jgi:hypothetical protein